MSHLVDVAKQILSKRPRNECKEIVMPRPKEHHVESFETSVVYVDEPLKVPAAIDQLLSINKLLGLDIETYPLPKYRGDKDAGLAPRKSGIRLLQIYDGIQSVFVFDLVKIGGIQMLPESLWTHAFVAHNALFELKHLLHAGVPLQKIGCTLLADRVLNGCRTKLRPEIGLSTSAGLKDLTKELFSIDISKKEQTSDWSAPLLTHEQIQYAALDAVLPLKIFMKQRDELQSKHLSRSYEILRDAQLAIAHMELMGIGFDIEQHQRRIEEWKKEKVRLQEEIARAVGTEFNLNSGKQVGAWLNDILKEEELDVWGKTETGKLSTSTPTFKLNEHVHQIFPKIVSYRQVAKKISSFGEGLYKFIDTSKGRLFGSFSLGSTSTGRMASQKPNLQNMPRSGFRDLFYAQEGYVLIGLDYSQQELRVAALVTGDKALLQIYKEGGDVHTNTAASILRIEKEAVTKPQRQLAKAVIFGLLYGQGAKGLARYARQQYGVEMSQEEAELHRSALFHTYPGLREWQRATGNLVKSTGKIRTQCGRLRDFNREQEGYRFTAALNLPIQGAAAEITLRAITRLTPFLSNEFRLVNVIHDEILLEIIEQHAQEAAEIAAVAMEAAFLDMFPSAQPYLKGIVEAKIWKNWTLTKL